MNTPDWDACANRHLLAFIVKQAAKGRHYCHPSDQSGYRRKTFHPLSIELARILRAHAHCWAIDIAENKYPPAASEQRASFEKAMELADRECRNQADECSQSPAPENKLIQPI